MSESINERIKILVTKKLITQDSRALRYWRKTIPNKYKFLEILSFGNYYLIVNFLNKTK